MGVEALKLVSFNVKGISNFHKRKTIIFILGVEGKMVISRF